MQCNILCILLLDVFIMKNRFGPLWIILPVALIILVDIYVFQAVRSVFSTAKPNTQRIANICYWLLSSVTYIAVLILILKGYSNWHGWSKILVIGVAQAIFFGKLLVVVFLFLFKI